MAEEQKYNAPQGALTVPSPNTIADEMVKRQKEMDEYVTTSEEYNRDMRRMEDLDPDHHYSASDQSDGLYSDEEWSEEDEQQPISPIQSKKKQESNPFPVYFHCLFAVLLLISVVMITLIVIYFNSMAGNTQDRSAYYRYLHTALDIRHNDLIHGHNTSVLESCHRAIHDTQVVQLYRAADIHLSHLDVNLEEMSQIQKTYRFKDLDSEGIPHGITNKKYQLIAMCETELQIMINKQKRRKSEQKRIARYYREKRAREYGWDSLMENADSIRNVTWTDRNWTVAAMIDACQLSLTNETVLAYYKTAGYPINTLRNRTTKVLPKDIYRHDLDHREELVLACAVTLVIHDMIPDTDNKTQLAIDEKATVDVWTAAETKDGGT